MQRGEVRRKIEWVVHRTALGFSVLAENCCMGPEQPGDGIKARDPGEGVPSEDFVAGRRAYALLPSGVCITSGTDTGTLPNLLDSSGWSVSGSHSQQTDFRSFAVDLAPARPARRGYIARVTVPCMISGAPLHHGRRRSYHTASSRRPARRALQPCGDRRIPGSPRARDTRRRCDGSRQRLTASRGHVATTA